jgi:hypothetical protein
MKLDTDSLPLSKIFSKQLALIFTLVLGVTVAWAADKPWKAKPFKEWTDKDIQTILTESPWVRVTPIQRTWLPVAEKDVAPDPQLKGGVRQMPNASTATNTPVREGEGSWRELNVIIYWQSSRVMRAATARQAVLHGETLDVDKYASEPQSEYQLILRMEDMTPFVQHDEKFFQDNAFLQTKKGKDKISPSHVVYEKKANGSIQDAIFFFPKATSAGSPTVSPDEKEVQFSCKIADTTVRVGFRPQEMVDQSGPAL